MSIIISFTDEFGAKHQLSPIEAANELRLFYNAWPGGLEEIQSCVAQLNERVHEYQFMIQQLRNVFTAHKDLIIVSDKLDEVVPRKTK